MRNVNLISIPGEASVNFATALNTNPAVTGLSIVSSSVSNNTVTFSGTGILINQAIILTATTISGLTTNTTYWLQPLGGAGTEFTVWSDPSYNGEPTITSNGTATVAFINMSQPKYFTSSKANASGFEWMIDASGFVWTTLGGLGWIWTGNNGQTNGHGNGLAYYQGSDGFGWIFAFADEEISYLKLANATGTQKIYPNAWVYGWNPSTGTSGNHGYLNNVITSASHEAMVASDNRVYYCDANYVCAFYQTTTAPPGSAVPFNPSNTSTYTFAQTAVIPFNDACQCLTQLGTNLLIGGQKNIIYQWDRFSPSNYGPILVAENNIVKMVTVNTNTYALVGNRGRIYITNGSQAQLFKKMPDHLSGTVEPYFTWGGLTSVKNQIYFSALVTTNGGVAINQYGGLWAIDVDTQAIRLVNKLSYGSYAGYATAVAPNFMSNPAGTGLYIGWDTGSGVFGIDTTVSTPYTGSQAYIISDLIPIGTFTMPRDFERVEYRLTKPMVSGESIVIYARLIFNTSDTGWGTAILNDSTVGNFSNSAPANFKNAQWIQMQAVINSTATNPSYTRLKEIRITGLQGTGPMQQISI